MSARPLVFLGLGSNLGEREAAIQAAVAALAAHGLEPTRRSSLYLTQPVGGPPQGWFVNAVVAGQTDLGPQALLARCLEVERRAGRTREVRHGPRTIDLDILFYGDLVRSTAELTIPHARLAERRFVLVPLVEIAPDLRHPLLGWSAAELLARCPDRSEVRLHAPAGAGA
jgi:2-amino-4-hydroxy-6-hydroxymethyldihydropteridine diphosphokinase